MSTGTIEQLFCVTFQLNELYLTLLTKNKLFLH